MKFNRRFTCNKNIDNNSPCYNTDNNLAYDNSDYAMQVYSNKKSIKSNHHSQRSENKRNSSGVEIYLSLSLTVEYILIVISLTLPLAYLLGISFSCVTIAIDTIG